MAIVKCKCGKSSMNFQHMSSKDLPEGYEEECCKLAQKAKQETEAKETPVEPEAAPAIEETPKEPQAEEKPRRGPKPKKAVAAQ